MVDIHYGDLFTIKLLHGFYNSGECPDFAIIPSAETSDILNGYGIICRQQGNMLFAGVRSDKATGIPFLLPKPGLRLTFYLECNNPLFNNFTNLPLSSPPGKVMYFTNRNNNFSNNIPFISSVIAGYSNTTTYQPGDLVVFTGDVYENIKTYVPPAATPDAGHWKKIGTDRFASAPDPLNWIPETGTYTFSAPQTTAAIKVSGYNPATEDYTLVVFSMTINFTNPVSSFLLDLSSLPAGKYMLDVNGTVQAVYLDDALKGSGFNGIIDIYNEAVFPDPYCLLDPANRLTSPGYVISFLTRATIWRYFLLPGSPGGTIADGDGVYTFSVTPDGIISGLPIPLNERGLPNIQLTLGGNIFSPLPGASPRSIAPLTVGTSNYYCSDIFINY